MSRWDKIPKIDLDWKQEPLEILKDSNDAYFRCARFCSEEILRSETWRLFALTSFAFNFLLVYCLVFAK